MPKMPRIFPRNQTASIVCANCTLAIVLLLLSGCAAFSLVPAEDLEAERKQRRALQLEERQLREQLTSLTAARGTLETRLAAETAKRQASEQRQEQIERVLEQRQEKLERDLAQQTAALEVLKGIELQSAQRQEALERVLEQHKSALEGLKLLEAKWERWRVEDMEQQLRLRQALNNGDASLYLLLLEKKAQIAKLSEQLENAILEVVRTKAKLHSLESKAEAASELAEAEIAVASLREQDTRWESDASLIKADELTKLSAREFQEGNYGGALYLTNQAKNVIKSTQARSTSQETSSMLKGEVAFALPLLLKQVGESDLLEGPGSQFKSLSSLEEGTALMGYSYKGQWVRVKTGDGASGWVFYKNLVSPD